MKRLLITLGVILATTCSPVYGQQVGFQVTPTHCLEKALRDLKQLFINHPKASYSEVQEVISWVFDLQETARRALGPAWNDATPQQQADFVESFSRLLLTSYVKKLRRANEVEIVFKSETIEGDRANVAADIVDGEDKHPIIFKMKSAGDIWQIYDLTIENIGLIVNYRNEFAAIIRKEGLDSLIKRLKEKSNA